MDSIGEPSMMTGSSAFDPVKYWTEGDGNQDVLGHFRILITFQNQKLLIHWQWRVHMQFPLEMCNHSDLLDTGMYHSVLCSSFCYLVNRQFEDHIQTLALRYCRIW